MEQRRAGAVRVAGTDDHPILRSVSPHERVAEGRNLGSLGSGLQHRLLLADPALQPRLRCRDADCLMLRLEEVAAVDQPRFARDQHGTSQDVGGTPAGGAHSQRGGRLTSP